MEYMESRRPGIFAQSVITRSRQRQGFVVMVSVLGDLDSVVGRLKHLYFGCPTEKPEQVRALL